MADQRIQCKCLYRVVPDAATQAEIEAAILSLEIEANVWMAAQPPDRFHWRETNIGRALKHLVLIMSIDYVKEMP